MKVNVYSKNGVLLKEFGEDPGASSRDGARSVVDCSRLSDDSYRIDFDDGLFPKYGFVYGKDVIVIIY